MAKKYKIKIGDDIQRDDDGNLFNRDISGAELSEYRKRVNRMNGSIEKEGKTVDQYYSDYPDKEMFDRKKTEEQRGRLISDKQGSILSKIKAKNGRS